jgi:hypothetical protein
MKIERIKCYDRKGAKRKAPWAARIQKIDGGFLAFESLEDYSNFEGASSQGIARGKLDPSPKN